jgi:hypothetical protein
VQEAVDAWSLGVVAFELLTRKPALCMLEGIDKVLRPFLGIVTSVWCLHVQRCFPHTGAYAGDGSHSRAERCEAAMGAWARHTSDHKASWYLQDPHHEIAVT